MSEFRIDQIKSQDSSRGPDIAGITTFTGTSGIVMPSGITEYRGGRDRGVIAGGFNGPAYTNTIDFITISTTGNAKDFGDLTLLRQFIGGGCSSSVRGIFEGGAKSGSPNATNIIDYVTISATGNAFDFGDLIQERFYNGSCSSSTRGVTGGGNNGNGFGSLSIGSIEFTTIATLGNAVSFGNLTSARQQVGSCSSPTRGLFASGANIDGVPATRSNTIDYVTIATQGDALDFGDLTITLPFGTGSLSSQTRGIFAGAYVSPTQSNVISYVTIASKGDAQDFGDLTGTRAEPAAVSNCIRGVIAGGYSAPARITTMDYITIATLGNATSFGTLTQGRSGAAACSDSHGGLGD
jgi:hypothetical protein